MFSTCQRPQIKILFFATLFLLCVVPSSLVWADSAEDELQQKINEKQNQYQSISKKLENIRSQKDQISATLADYAKNLNATQAQIDAIQAQVNKVNKELEEINAQLNDRKGTLSDKTTLRNKLLRNYSKISQTSDLELLFSGLRLSSFSYGYARHASEQILETVDALNGEIDSFEKDKAEALSLKNEMETEQQKFLALKNDLANKKNLAQAEVNVLGEKESTYERDLSNLQEEIDALSAQQQAIISSKSGEGTSSIGEYESPEASVPSPSSSLGKPVFAAFSYGAYTHYNGMSQYGAKGRADAGQKYTAILKFYYKSDIKEQSGIDSKKISVQGYGSPTFRDYLYGIAEMPTNWPLEALKAQAVAARTYAYRYTGAFSKAICTTQSCQVFNKDKMNKVKSGQYPNWKKAVDETENEILKENVSSQYSSTTGGYINNIGWDTKGGSWPNDAYEKKAKSPWFYKSWYTKSYSDSSTCNRSSPWLSSKEMADILNSWVVWRKGSKSDVDKISPVSSCWGGDPYSVDEMASKADKYAEKYASVSNIEVDIGSNGQTSKVTLSTNNGTVSVPGQEFKTVFNLRAPGYISIRSRLFDFESQN